MSGDNLKLSDDGARVLCFGGLSCDYCKTPMLAAWVDFEADGELGLSCPRGGCAGRGVLKMMGNSPGEVALMVSIQASRYLAWREGMRP